MTRRSEKPAIIESGEMSFKYEDNGARVVHMKNDRNSCLMNKKQFQKVIEMVGHIKKVSGYLKLLDCPTSNSDEAYEQH